MNQCSKSAGGFEVMVGITGMLMIIIAFITCVVCLENKRDAAYKQRKQACRTLDPKYGQYFTAKEGPYAGIAMEAVGFSAEMVGLYIPGGDRNLWFDCGSLVRVER